MGYFEILKKAFHVTNRNLLALLAQFVLWTALMLIALLGVVVVVAWTSGLAALDISTLNPDIIFDAIRASIAAIFIVVLALSAYMFVALFLSAFVQAGVIGCLADTAKDAAEGFTARTFFSSARHSWLSLLWLYILWMLIGVAIFAVIVFTGIIVFTMVLIPMRDAGNQVGAFLIGVPLLVMLFVSFIAAFFMLYSVGTVSTVSLVGERRKATDAMGRAYDFVMEHFWDVMLFALLVLFVGFALNMVGELVTLPIRLTVQLGGESVMVILLIFVMIIMTVFQTYVSLFILSCFVVYYVDRTTPPKPIIPVVRPQQQPPQRTAAPAQPQRQVPPAPPDQATEPDLSEWTPEPLDPDEPPKHGGE